MSILKFNVFELNVSGKLIGSGEEVYKGYECSKDGNKLHITMKFGESSIMYTVPFITGSTLRFAEKQEEGLFTISPIHQMLFIIVSMEVLKEAKISRVEAKGTQRALETSLKTFEGINSASALLPSSFIYDSNGKVSSSNITALGVGLKNTETVDLSSKMRNWPAYNIDSYESIKNSFNGLLKNAVVISGESYVEAESTSVASVLAAPTFFFKPLGKLLSYSAMPDSISYQNVADTFTALLRPDLMAPKLLEALSITSANSAEFSDTLLPDTVGELISYATGKVVGDKIGWVLDTDIEYYKQGSVNVNIHNLLSFILSGKVEVVSGRLKIGGKEVVTEEFSKVQDVVIVEEAVARELVSFILVLLSVHSTHKYNVSESKIKAIAANPRLLRMLDSGLDIK